MARKGTRRGRKGLRGGGLGQSYTFGAPIVDGLGNAQEVVPISSCLAAARPGMVPTPTTGLGLPGLSGGGRRGSRKGGRRTRKQRGGRYSFDLSQQITPAAPWAGGIPQVIKIPCEAATHNPLNAVQRGGVGGIDSAFYSAPTAGYSNQPSTWVGSTGAPSLIQTPYEARTLNPACLKTGGGRRRGSRRGRRRGSRKQRV
jgi:hypothetical protein